MIKPRADFLILTFAALFFFVSSGILAFNMPAVYNSPDENANAVFTEQVRLTGTPDIFDPFLALSPLLHPRSVINTGLHVLPGSFLGLPFYYGYLARATDVELLRYFTPLLAVLAIFCWRRIVEEVFRSRTVALVAALGLMFHPAFWYWSARSMMHNVPFIALMIIALYVAVVRPRFLWLSGLLFGTAIMFRSVELFWIIPIVFLLLVRFQRELGLGRIIGFMIGVAIAIAPMLVLNQQLYGNMFETGYTYHQTSDAAITASTLPVPNASFLELGKSILRNSWHYSVTLFPWLSFAAALGFLTRIQERRERLFAVVAVLTTALLWIFYGSYTFRDNPDTDLITIGTSYTRYWLPIFALASPYVAWLIVWLSDRVRVVTARKIVLVGLTVLMITLSIRPVFLAEDGLIGVRAALLGSYEKQQRVLAVTEEEAVIIVDRADKFLWPDRHVVYPLRSEETYAAMPKLAAGAPLYYFGITLPEGDLVYLNTEKLPPLGLQIEHVVTVEDESLYHIYEALR